MFRKYGYIKIIILLAAAFLISSCASSSNSARYNSKTDDSKNSDSSVRFTSKDSDQKTQMLSEENDEEYLDDPSDEDEFPDMEPVIDISSVVSKYSSRDNSAVDVEGSSVKEKVLMEIIKYLNTPYKYGGNSKKGIDCSAFTQTVYATGLQLPLLRTARDQFTQGIKIEDKTELKFGDLVFFNTRRAVRPGHVGIYIGDNLFAHASSKQGVIVSSLDHDYYSKRYMGARRIEDVF
jgi:cell wall-associated NlpC family hydrolase